MDIFEVSSIVYHFYQRIDEHVKNSELYLRQSHCYSMGLEVQTTFLLYNHIFFAPHLVDFFLSHQFSKCVKLNTTFK